jgi:hypothetical protein
VLLAEREGEIKRGICSKEAHKDTAVAVVVLLRDGSRTVEMTPPSSVERRAMLVPVLVLEPAVQGVMHIHAD